MKLKGVHHLLVILFVFLTQACQSDIGDPFIPSDQKLVVHLKFDKDLRNNINGALPISVRSQDYSSSTVSDANSYKFTSDRFGRANSALLLEGKSYLEYPFYSNASILEPIYYDNFTFAAWVKIDSIESTDVNVFKRAFISTIASADNRNLGIVSVEIQARTPQKYEFNHHYITSHCDTPDGTLSLSSGSALDSSAFFSRFQHICVTKSNDVLRLYINGELVPSDDGPPGLTTDPQVPPFSFKVGRFFIGALDDVRFYSRAFTYHEVNLLFKL